jgi:hypothetical protein
MFVEGDGLFWAEKLLFISANTSQTALRGALILGKVPGKAFCNEVRIASFLGGDVSERNGAADGGGNVRARPTLLDTESARLLHIDLKGGSIP